MKTTFLFFCLCLFFPSFVFAFTNIVVTGTWTNPNDARIAGTVMERSINGTDWIVACKVDKTATQCTDTPQPLVGPNGEPLQYHYHLRSFNDVQFSDPTVERIIDTGKPTAPADGAYIITVK